MERGQLEKRHASQPRLIVFDVEGVLIPKNRFIYDAIKNLGFLKLLKALCYGFLYRIGLLSLGSALKRIFKMMGGMPQQKLLDIAGNIHLMPGVKETIRELKEKGNKIAMISSGLPTYVVRHLADVLEADYGLGFEIGLDGNKLDGRISGDVIECEGKHAVLSDILASEKLRSNECVVVADDRNNVPMFHSSGLRIGYNADFLTRLKADYVITRDLSKIIPIIEGRPLRRRLPSGNDFLRETIHLAAIIVPALVLLVGINAAALLICAVSTVYTFSEILRINGRKLPLISQITNLAASESELHEFAAAPIYFALGILFCLLLFPVTVSSGAIAIFCAGDSSASLFGGLSRTVLPINKGKSWEGSLTGFVFAFLTGCFFLTPWEAMAGAFVAMIVEALPLPVNDNITMPLSVGLVLAIFT